jgi:hypothetical protein
MGNSLLHVLHQHGYALIFVAVFAENLACLCRATL